MLDSTGFDPEFPDQETLEIEDPVMFDVFRDKASLTREGFTLIASETRPQATSVMARVMARESVRTAEQETAIENLANQNAALAFDPNNEHDLYVNLRAPSGAAVNANLMARALLPGSRIFAPDLKDGFGHLSHGAGEDRFRTKKIVRNPLIRGVFIGALQSVGISFSDDALREIESTPDGLTSDEHRTAVDQFSEQLGQLLCGLDRSDKGKMMAFERAWDEICDEGGDSLSAVRKLRIAGNPNHAHKLYDVTPYRANEQGLINYSDMATQIETTDPPFEMVILGFSANPHDVDYATIVKAAHSRGALVMMDAAHIAGLIAAGVMRNPFDFGVDVITTTTHKTLCGEKGAAMMVNQNSVRELVSAESISAQRLLDSLTDETYDFELDVETMASHAETFRIAATPEFAEFGRQVVENNQAFAHAMGALGWKVLGTGTPDNHITLIDVGGSPFVRTLLAELGDDFKGDLDGEFVAEAATFLGISSNKNGIPGKMMDGRRVTAHNPQGWRLGSVEATLRGLKPQDMEDLARRLTRTIENVARKKCPENPTSVDTLSTIAQAYGVPIDVTEAFIEQEEVSYRVLAALSQRAQEEGHPQEVDYSWENFRAMRDTNPTWQTTLSFLHNEQDYAVWRSTCRQFSAVKGLAAMQPVDPADYRAVRTLALSHPIPLVAENRNVTLDRLESDNPALWEQICPAAKQRGALDMRKHAGRAMAIVETVYDAAVLAGLSGDYSEGAPPGEDGGSNRYYKGCKAADEAEWRAQQAMGERFSRLERESTVEVNALVQAPTPQMALSLAVMGAVQQGANIMAPQGTGESEAGLLRRFCNIQEYEGVDVSTGRLDMIALAQRIREEKPELIILRTSLSPVREDYSEVYAAAAEAGTVVLVDFTGDMGLVLNGVFPNPMLEGAHIAITTTSGSLRGHKSGAIVLYNQARLKPLTQGRRFGRGQKATQFPGGLGGPDMVSITAQLESFLQAESEEAQSFVRDSRALALTLAQELERKGWIVTGGAGNVERHFVDANLPDQAARDVRGRLAAIGVDVDLSCNAEGETVRFTTAELAQQGFPPYCIKFLAHEIHQTALGNIRSAAGVNETRGVVQEILRLQSGSTVPAS